jgi:hypothetical protein
MAGIPLHQGLSPQHVADQCGLSRFRETACFAQFLIGFLRPAESRVREAQEQVALDREIALGGKGLRVSGEQRESVLRTALSEQNLRIEQAKFHFPRRVAPRTPGPI